MAKLFLIFNLGFWHPFHTGAYEAWTYNNNPKWDIINTKNDHVHLFLGRVAIAGGVLSSFYWSKDDPSAKELILTGIGTILVRDAVANFTFKAVDTGSPFARQKLPDLRLGFVELKGFEMDGKFRLLELGIGVGLLVLSEIIE